MEGLLLHGGKLTEVDHLSGGRACFALSRHLLDIKAGKASHGQRIHFFTLLHAVRLTLDVAFRGIMSTSSIVDRLLARLIGLLKGTFFDGIDDHEGGTYSMLLLNALTESRKSVAVRASEIMSKVGERMCRGPSSYFLRSR